MKNKNRVTNGKKKGRIIRKKEDNNKFKLQLSKILGTSYIYQF
jgi:hypothetical protein